MMTENLPQSISKIWNSAFYIFLTGGILTSYLFSSEEAAQNWRLVFSFPLLFDVPRLILLLIVYRMESPVFLFEKLGLGDHTRHLIEENYKYIYTAEDAVKKTELMIKEQQKIDSLTHDAKNEEKGLLSPTFRKPFLFILYLNFLN